MSSKTETILQSAVDVVKPTVRKVVDMVQRYPEAAVGVAGGYVIGAQVEKIWGVRYLTGGSLKYILAAGGLMLGYDRALRRRKIEAREREIASRG